MGIEAITEGVARMVGVALLCAMLAGAALVGLGWAVWWLFHHVSLSFV